MSFVAKQITLFQLAEVVRSLTGPFLRRCVAGFLLSPSAPPVLTKLQPTKIKMHTQRNVSEGLNVYQILRKVFNSIFLSFTRFGLPAESQCFDAARHSSLIWVRFILVECSFIHMTASTAFVADWWAAETWSEGILLLSFEPFHLRNVALCVTGRRCLRTVVFK